MIYLRRGTAGKARQLADARSSCGVTGADEDRRADLHGVAILGCLGGFAGHGERRKGVPFFGVLLGVRVLWGIAVLGCCRGTFSSINSWHRRLIPFYQLLRSRVKLQTKESTQDSYTILKDSLRFIFNQLLSRIEHHHFTVCTRKYTFLPHVRCLFSQYWDFITFVTNRC